MGRMPDLKILLIEDEPGDAVLIRRMLKGSPFGSFHIHWVTSLSGAREEMEGEEFDILLLDLSLPDSSGLETVRQGQAAALGIPLVVLTGHDDPDFALSTLDSGVQDYLVKGNFQASDLIRSIRYALARSRTEKALRESEARHRALFAAIGDAVLLLDGQTMVDCNPAAISLFATRNKEGLLGQTILHFSPPTQPSGERTAQVVENRIEETLKQGVSRFEWLHTRTGGEEFSAEVVLTSINLEGKTLIQAVVRDITERKEAEKKLVQSKERFRKIFNEGPLGMALLDLDGRFFEVNDKLCTMTGFSREELLPLTFKELLWPSPRGPFQSQGKEVKVRTEEPGEYPLRTKENQMIWVSVKETLIQDREGISHYALLMLENITQSKSMMEQLARYTQELELANTELESTRNQALDASRAKSQFMAVMSHEIRNPMNSIIGMADLLAETELTQEQKEYVQIFRGAGETLINLIDDMLDLTRIESGRLQLLETSFSLEEVVDKTMVLMNMKAREKSLQLEWQIEPGVPRFLQGDPGKLRQVMINLLTNAIKFTAQGFVRLNIEEEKGSTPQQVRLLFSVTDSGIGIPREQWETIFEDFVQGDPSTTRSYGGTGLGLGICRRLVTLMEGEIWVSSQVDKGSTFFFTAGFTPGSREQLKREQEEKKALGEDPPSSTPKGPLQILLVEDSLDNRLLIQAYLKKTPHTLTMVENGEQALNAVKKKEYDLLLMDIQMPVMDGYMATRAIRDWEGEEQKSPVPIVALTAYALEEEVNQALAAGFTGHLSKPVKKRVLLAALARYSSQ